MSRPVEPSPPHIDSLQRSLPGCPRMGSLFQRSSCQRCFLPSSSESKARCPTIRWRTLKHPSTASRLPFRSPFAHCHCSLVQSVSNGCPRGSAQVKSRGYKFPDICSSSTFSAAPGFAGYDNRCVLFAPCHSPTFCSSKAIVDSRSFFVALMRKMSPAQLALASSARVARNPSPAVPSFLRIASRRSPESSRK